MKDHACVGECPVDCIYKEARMLYIRPEECADCGACESVCPTEAVFYEDDPPEQWSDYYHTDINFFRDLGSPRGAQRIGAQDFDDGIIAALPPQNAQ